MAASYSPVRRLTTYWKIEAFNVVLIPAVAAFLVLRSGGTISVALVLSGLACSFLLVIGTIVLRMMLRRACGDANAIEDQVPLLLQMRWPAIGLCVAAAVALGVECINIGPRLSTQFVMPAVLLILALLEYINYYHVQLQHFDHAADWKRLISGRGFRRSHLAREIERWKRERAGGEGIYMKDNPCPFSVGQIVVYRPSERGRMQDINTDLADLVPGKAYRVVRIESDVYVVVEGFENSPGGGLYWTEFSEK